MKPGFKISCEAGTFAARVEREIPGCVSLCGSKEAMVDAKSPLALPAIDSFPTPLDVAATPASPIETPVVELSPGLRDDETKPGELPPAYSLSGDSISVTM